MTLQCSDLQGGVHLVREHPTEAIRHKVAHPSNSTEWSSAGLSPMYAGLWTLTLTYSCMMRGWPVKQKQKQIQITLLEQRRQHHFPAQATILLTFEGPRTRLRCRGAQTRHPICRQCVQPEGYSRHPPNPLSILVNLTDNRFHCPTNSHNGQ